MKYVSFLNNDKNLLSVTRSITDSLNVLFIAIIGSKEKAISPREPCLMTKIFLKFD